MYTYQDICVTARYLDTYASARYLDTYASAWYRWWYLVSVQYLLWYVTI